MTVDEVLSEISKIKELPQDMNEFWDNISQNDAFFLWCVTAGVEISEPEDLDQLDAKLQKNLKARTPSLAKMDYWGRIIIDNISEDAYCRTFSVPLIREAFYKGFYPMSVSIEGLHFLSIRYHNKKCLITPETFRIPHNIRKLIEKKFGDYTLTFNKAFSQCVEAIRTAYPENWLFDELVEAFTEIHENPDKRVSVDSVEIWHDGKLVAGEIGFITGNSYASLSGFHRENDIGNVQMALLGRYLFDNGFAYWDLGMSIPYKYRYGAFDNNRQEQESFRNNLMEEIAEFPKNTEIPLRNFLEKDLEQREETLDTEKIIPFPEPNTKYSFLSRQVCEITDSIPLQLLYSAYMQGVFPWFNEEDNEPVAWYSTDPRFVLLPEDFHCPKSLKKFMKKSPYTYTMDNCFRRVMTECGKMKRPDQDGTWIGPKMLDAYTKLHKAGYAHSFEVWHKGRLAGGFYGVLIGSVFCGESMFTLEPDSSKSAFVLFMKAFKECGGIIVDSQSYTDNIARYGAKNISRDAFLRIEKEALKTPLQKDFNEEFMKLADSYSRQAFSHKNQQSK